ncbi:MAG TPA: mechanosensitive ion channel family protein [Firmicutes bacterium]|nr:mechanosensitive ion channel family protein [Bacillota bacterium]
MDLTSLTGYLPEVPVEPDFVTNVKGQAVGMLNKIILAAIVFFVGWLLIGNLKKLFEKLLMRGRLDKALVNLLGSVLTFAGWIIVIAAIFKVLGFTEVSLAFSGSLALVAMGLATSASSIVGDLFSGVSLIADDDFQLGSRVTAAGVTGVVESIDMRKTRIRDDKGNLFVIPNKAIDNGTVTIISPPSIAEEEEKKTLVK